MKISQAVLVLSSIMVLDATNTNAASTKAKKTVKTGNAQKVNIQSGSQTANMAGLMARVRRGGWDRN